MFTLNIICTYLAGYYNRNDKVRRYLDELSTDFPEGDEVIDALNSSADFINAMNLPAQSMWWNKANFFSLVAELARSPALRSSAPVDAAKKLLEFSTAVPADYALAAREGVGRKAQRELRGEAIRHALS
jgi:hypothetical protein